MERDCVLNGLRRSHVQLDQSSLSSFSRKKNPTAPPSSKPAARGSHSGISNVIQYRSYCESNDQVPAYETTMQPHLLCISSSSATRLVTLPGNPDELPHEPSLIKIQHDRERCESPSSWNLHRTVCAGLEASGSTRVPRFDRVAPHEFTRTATMGRQNERQLRMSPAL